MFLKAKKDIVGIDIGSSAVKLVQLREVKGAYHLSNLGVALFPPEAIVDNSIMDSSTVVETIRSLVESQNIKTKNVATAISGHSVIIRKIQLPMMTEEEMESSIHFEAEHYIPFDISEVNLDFFILGPDTKDPALMNVVLVAAKKDFVNDYVSVLRECGLTPLIMDIGCFALENAFDINYAVEPDEVLALINIGASAMNVNILKGGISVFTRDIQVGGNMINEEIQKRLSLSSEEAESAKLGGDVAGVEPSSIQGILKEAAESLAQEVQRSLDFFSATSSDEKVHKLLVAGGGSLLSQVHQSLGRRLGIPVEVFDSFRQIVVNEKDFDLEYLQAVGPQFAVAVGLAMRRLGDK